MTSRHLPEPTPRQPLRLWPGVVAAALLSLVRLGLPILAPDQGGTAILAGLAGGLVVVLWWLVWSRAHWLERVGAIAVMALTVFATSFFVHESIANGMMGMMLVIYAVPVLSVALVAWAVTSGHLSAAPRRLSMVAIMLLVSGAFTLLRTGGMTGDATSDLHWRWTLSPEERLLADAADQLPGPARGGSAVLPPDPSTTSSSSERLPIAASDGSLDAPPASPPPRSASAPESSSEEHAPAPSSAAVTPGAGHPRAAIGEARWPGFRGAGRDGIVRGVRIETDWSRAKPVELWRRPIGPGWSSFAVAGDRIFTQEQRGDDEIVSAYDLNTGEPVWRHRDAARFWESNGGAGPRATPTLSHGRVYTLGGTGILNALDARDGSLIWSRNAASDTGRQIPDWGIASSPLVVDDVVIAAAAGSLAAYDAASGAPRWTGPKAGSGYSSPHPSTIDGVMQIVLLNGTGAIAVSPSDGALLWSHAWSSDGIVQPAVVDGDILIGSGSGLGAAVGLRRVAIARGPGGWTAEERWTTNGLKPYFNDFVVHEGHAFGFDGGILACVDLEDGRRTWKGGRYGHGQLVVLADQDLLLVLSEEGELALVSATPDKFTELARVPAIEGKTWNHPVLAGDVLLVRNGEEMAAFRLARAGR